MIQFIESDDAAFYLRFDRVRTDYKNFTKAEWRLISQHRSDTVRALNKAHGSKQARFVSEKDALASLKTIQLPDGVKVSIPEMGGGLYF